MAHKTFLEYCDLLDKYKKAGKIPNGKKVTRDNTTEYFLSKYTFADVRVPNQTIGSGGFRRWYEWWRNGTGPRQGFRPERKKQIENFEMLEDLTIGDIDLGIADGDSCYTPPVILSGNLKIGVLSDIHFPFHNLPVLKLAINHLRKENVDVILLNGDTFDFYKCSRYLQVPNRPSMRVELEMGRTFLRQLRLLFPSAQILFKMGNHENRLEHYILNQAPALYGIEALSIDRLLNFAELKVQLVGSHQLVQAGDLNILHGHEIQASGVNIARSVRLKTGGSILISHHHKTAHEAFKVVGGKTEHAYVIGCLCDLWPDYCIFNQMNNGFAVVHLKENGSFRVENLRIEKEDGSDATSGYIIRH